MNTKVIVFVCVIVSLAGLNAAERKIRIGVLDFGMNNIAKAEAAVVSDMVRSELVRVNKFDVLDRKNMDNVLKEQAFQQTGCTESSCVVQVGKILNMQFMIYGTISRLFQEYILQVEMIDIETTKIVRSSKVKFSNIEDVEKNIRIIALDLANTGEYDYEEINLRRNASLSGVWRNGAITLGCAALLTTGIILGNYYDGLGTQKYGSYLSIFDSQAAQTAGDEYQNTYNAADAWFYVAESATVLTAAFLAWGIFDYITFMHYDYLYAKYKPKVSITPERTTLSFSFTF